MTRFLNSSLYHDINLLFKIILSEGISGAMWEEFPPKVQTALMDALVEWGPELTSQEISNLCYG